MECAVSKRRTVPRCGHAARPGDVRAPVRANGRERREAIAQQPSLQHAHFHGLCGTVTLTVPVLALPKRSRVSTVIV
jgi:hypothetical protein